MSNTYKTLIAILTLSILAGATMIYFNSQARNIDKFTTISSPSPFQADSSQSPQVKSVISSSQVIKPVSSQIVSEVKVVTVPVVQTGQTTENIDGVQITYLDSKNPPQYIKDYLACETKDLKNSNGDKSHYGIFLEDPNGTISYKCPPKMESLGCSKNIVFVSDINQIIPSPKSENGLYLRPYQEGWNCDQFYASQIVSPDFINFCDFISSDLLRIYSIFNKEITCLSLTNFEMKPITKSERVDFQFKKILILK